MEQKDLPCAFISLDKSEAFDSSVYINFVFYKHMDLETISYHGLNCYILNDISSNVIVNFMSDPFNVQTRLWPLSSAVCAQY